ncbi:MAG: putative dihydroxyacetone kinase subunit 2, partial [Ilumatobacteraceae bacterium]|nr:putative dihydroxyacetone kinase subunit 2 [Ilumatobacteraceae bacterium]
MSATAKMSGDDWRRAFLAVCDEVESEHEALSALDAIAGDGDLGESLNLGFGHVRTALMDGAIGTPAETFVQVGTLLSTKAPSTFGTLVGMAFRDAGKSAPVDQTWSAADVVQALTDIAASVSRRGHAEPGQRTMLDAIVGSRDAAKNADHDIRAALREAAWGARVGALSTAAMTPIHGRAAWVGERAEGTVDAG